MEEESLTFIYFTELYLIYNIVLFSGEQQSDLVIHTHNIYTHTYKFFLIFFPLCFCSVTKLCVTLCHPMDCSMPGSSVLHYLLEFAQIHVYPPDRSTHVYWDLRGYAQAGLGILR